jgi:BON domain
MRHTICALLLLFGMTAFAQVQRQPGPPAGSTPPTFPQDKNPSKQMPPDTAAPPPSGQPTSGEVQQQINQKLSQEPGLKNTNVRFDVDDQSVVVGGSVADEQQHQLALRLARSYAGDRKIVDYVKVQSAK